MNKSLTATDFLSIEEYCKEYDCIRATVYNRIKSGKIPPSAILKIGGKTLFNKHELKLTKTHNKNL